MTRRLAIAAATLLLCTPAWASSAMCWFDVPTEPGVFDLEFATGEPLGQIYRHGVTGAGGSLALPYRLIAFDRSADRVHLVYDNPGDPRLPPSFTLDGAGDRVRVVLADRELVGTLDCNRWMDKQ